MGGGGSIGSKEEEEVTLTKSKDPHLAGGEKKVEVNSMYDRDRPSLASVWVPWLVWYMYDSDPESSHRDHGLLAFGTLAVVETALQPKRRPQKAFDMYDGKPHTGLRDHFLLPSTGSAARQVVTSA